MLLQQNGFICKGLPTVVEHSRRLRAVGSNPTQGSSFLKKRVVLDVKLFVVALLIVL